MHNSDYCNFVQFIRQMPAQITNSITLTEKLSLRKLPTDFANIVFTGMGGSAIAGDLLNAYIESELTVPFLLNRNYRLPNFVNDKTLVFVCSYSGNTEETLSATRQALERNAIIVGLTSGGQLQKLAEKKGFPCIQLPEGSPPRQALGYMFFSVLHFMENLGIVKSKQSEIDETVKVLIELRERNDPQNTKTHNLGKHIAQKLYKKVPIIYTASKFLYPVVIRWRNQFNENSKTLAFSNVFPELNHNEIMGCESPKELLLNFNIVLLRDKSETQTNRRRLEITRDMLRKCGLPIFEVFSEGESLLTRMFSQIYLGDWVSYYLALLYGKDPIRIDSIQHLKEALAHIK